MRLLPRRGGDRDLSLVISSVGVSAAGDFVAFVALVLLAKDMTGSGFGVAAIALCIWGPSVVLPAVAGLVADRVESVRLVVAMSLVQAAVAAALALTPDFGLVLLLTAILGTANAISQPAEFALVPAVTGGSRERLAAANGYVEAARYAGLIGGPLLGGVLVEAGGTSLAMLVDAASFLFVAAAVGSLTARRRVDAAPAGSDVGRARAGLDHVRRDGLLALAVGTTTAGVLLMSISIPADPFFAEDDLDAGPTGFAALGTAWGVGMVAGSLVVARRVPTELLLTGIMAGIVVQGLGKPIGAVSMLFPVAVAGYALGGLGHGARNVFVRTLIHHRTPDALHGRVFAAYNALRNGAEMGALAMGGALVALIGARTTLIVAGLGQAAIGAGAMAFLARRGDARPAGGGCAEPASGVGSASRSRPNDQGGRAVSAEDKIREGAQTYLEGGEEVLAAFVARPRGWTQAMAGVRGLGQRQQAASVGGAEAAGFQLASPMALAITPRRLLSFELGATAGMGHTGDVKELVGEAPLGDVESIKVKRLLLGKVVTVTVRGQEFKLEVGAGGNASGVQEAFEQARTPV